MCKYPRRPAEGVGFPGRWNYRCLWATCGGHWAVNPALHDWGASAPICSAISWVLEQQHWGSHPPGSNDAWLSHRVVPSCCKVSQWYVFVCVCTCEWGRSVVCVCEILPRLALLIYWSSTCRSPPQVPCLWTVALTLPQDEVNEHLGPMLTPCRKTWRKHNNILQR